MAQAKDELDFKVDQSYGTENKAVDLAFKIVAEARPPKARTGNRITVGPASEIAPGQRRIIETGSLSIGVFNLNGNFYAAVPGLASRHPPTVGGPPVRPGLRRPNPPLPLARLGIRHRYRQGPVRRILPRRDLSHGNRRERRSGDHPVERTHHPHSGHRPGVARTS
jgi:hypothetical protein